MMVSNGGSVFRLFQWQWKNTLWFACLATVVVLLHVLAELSWLHLPTVPVAVIGGALGIFVSFRTNSAYDRWWEGRKLWGRMINTSRHFSSQVLSYLPREDGKPSEVQKTLVRRHVAYVHALRSLLRVEDPFEDEDFLRMLPGEVDPWRHESNLTHALLATQLDAVVALHDDGKLDAFRLSDFDESLRHLLDIQGGCERIKKTPMPRGYSFIAERLILAFGVLFPLSIVATLSWATIPISVIVCLAFALISEAGRILEDPFTMFYNGLPLSQISRMIEVNLEDRLGTPKAEQPTDARRQRARHPDVISSRASLLPCGMDTVTIDSRFNGPDGSANGGYACGLVAGLMSGDATVRLRAKPPLDTPLAITRTEAGVELHDGDTFVAQGLAPTTDWEEVPSPPSLDEARAAQKRYTGFHDHVFPRCFVCGPEREAGDGLRLFAGPLEDRPMAACAWSPGPAFLSPDGTVDPLFVWAALDCPSFFGLKVPYDKLFLLAEMSARLQRPVPGDEPLVVYGWGRTIEGRKHYAGAAIATADGVVRAHAQHLWIEARPG